MDVDFEYLLNTYWILKRPVVFIMELFLTIVNYWTLLIIVSRSFILVDAVVLDLSFCSV